MLLIPCTYPQLPTQRKCSIKFHPGVQPPWSLFEGKQSSKSSFEQTLINSLPDRTHRAWHRHTQFRILLQINCKHLLSKHTPVIIALYECEGRAPENLKCPSAAGGWLAEPKRLSSSKLQISTKRRPQASSPLQRRCGTAHASPVWHSGASAAPKEQVDLNLDRGHG